jgi:hypothetical protein
MAIDARPQVQGVLNFCHSSRIWFTLRLIYILYIVVKCRSLNLVSIRIQSLNVSTLFERNGDTMARVLNLFCSLFRDAVSTSEYVASKFLERSRMLPMISWISDTNFWCSLYRWLCDISMDRLHNHSRSSESTSQWKISNCHSNPETGAEVRTSTLHKHFLSLSFPSSVRYWYCSLSNFLVFNFLEVIFPIELR